VAARRLLILMLVLLGVSTLAAALVPVDPDALRDESTTTSTSTATRAATGKLVRASIDADKRNSQTVRVQVGDQLQLRVESPKRADEVEIPALDELEDVDPDAPAHFDLLLFVEGRFPVRLVDADRQIGAIEVSKPRKRD
jgi:hypothetical protein